MNFNEMIKLVYRLVFFFYHTITSLTRFIKWNKLFLVLNFLVNIKVCRMHKIEDGQNLYDNFLA